MKNSFRVVKKELDKIFKFPRMIFTSLILPGLILFLIYAFMGAGINSMIDDTIEEESKIYVVNFPDSLEFVFEVDLDMNFEIIKAEDGELEELKQKVLDGEIDAIMYYDKDFDDLVNTETLPKVEVLYDSTSTTSGSASNKALTIISIHQQVLYDKFGINPQIFTLESKTIEDESQSGALILAMLLPTIIMTFIFASALGIGTDAIAGEKDRGTLATLLMLPVKRSEIIVGKIISTSTLTILSALSSFIGLLASLPFSSSIFGLEGGVNYGVLEIVGLVVILLLIALFASTVLLIISTLAKNIKEASTMAMPIYIIAIISPFISIFALNDPSSKLVYVLPIFNTISTLREILSFNFNLVNFIITFGSSIAYITLFIFILIRLFKSERVLYSK